ncbi:MAG: PQQ-dependent dehydrogenase, methanol/ethanol family [Pseudomonadales bacterium]
MWTGISGLRLALALFTLMTLGACQQPEQSATADRPAVPAADVDWPYHGFNLQEDRFARLEDVNAANVSGLGLAWYLDTGERLGHEATPIVVDGVIYVTTPWSKVIAVDARTGAELWRYDPEVPRQTGYWACCDAVNRGVAVAGERVFVASLDGRLIALDRHDGSRLWQTLTVDPARPYTITGAPRVVKDMVVIGNAGAEYGTRGYVTAYDVASGAQRWRFYTVPGDPTLPQEGAHLEQALSSWTGDLWWQTGGGGTAWDSMAYDPELDLLYIGTGNGSPWNRYLRSPGGGDNLYLSCIVAVEPDTGRMRWYYQTTPGDNWDYTATQHIILADLELRGRLRKVAMQAPKNGFFYVLDRETGELISAEPYIPINWASHVDQESGRPVERAEGQYANEPRWVRPGPLGGHNWHPMSYSPVTGLVYIPGRTADFLYANEEGFNFDRTTRNVGVDRTLQVRHPEAVPEDPPDPQPMLLAWDPAGQRERWRVPLDMPGGGVLATAGNLVFQGRASGELVAYAADSGERLWSYQTQRGVIAPPVSYRLDGEQYVLLLAGWGGAGRSRGSDSSEIDNLGGGRLLAFKLGADGGLPALPERPAPVVWLQPATASPDALLQGEVLYQTHCGSCHGRVGALGGAIPNLAYVSPETEGSFDAIVLLGARLPRGMPRFDSVLDESDTALILDYLRSAAHDLGSTSQTSEH